MRWAGHAALMGEGRGVYRVLVGRPLDRRLGGPQSRSERGVGEKNYQPPPGIEP
jgi:hypothetical protein